MRRSGHFPRVTSGPAHDSPADGLYLDSCVSRDDASLRVLRGFDLVEVDASARERILVRMRGDEPRQYATFLIHDWKNKRVVEWSSSPDEASNYFTGGDLPYGISPAYFKPEVLLHYRANPEQYRVLPDRIECIGAWSLGYYVNDEGQVHAYLCDLAKVPFEEQLRWKASNERPRGGLAKEAFIQDFEGQFVDDYDPLLCLQEILREFPQEDANGSVCDIWTLKATSAECNPEVLGYVVTGGVKEYHDQVLNLAKIVVEGLSAKTINRLSKRTGCRDEPLGTIRQLGRLLDALGVKSSQRDAIVGPLAEVQEQRSKQVAHVGKDEARGDRKEAFRALLEHCESAMSALAGLVRQGTFAEASLPGTSGPPRHRTTRATPSSEAKAKPRARQRQKRPRPQPSVPARQKK